MPVNIQLLKQGDNSPESFNTPLVQLNTGKEDRLPLPYSLGLVLTSDLKGQKSWIQNLELGTDATTAYRGDYGQIAYNHSQSPHDYYPNQGGKIKGDIDLNTHKLILSTTNTLEVVAADTVVTSNGFLKIKGLGIKIDSAVNDLTIRSYSGQWATGIGLYLNGDFLTFGRWQSNVDRPQDELVLYTSSPKIYIGDQVRAGSLTAPVVVAGTSQLDSSGLKINGVSVIDGSGTISGANIDLVADYESAWIYVTGGNYRITVPHNMGSRPRISQIIFSHDNSTSLTKDVYTIPHIQTQYNNYWWYWWYGWNGYGANCHTILESYNSSTYTIKTGAGGVYSNGDTQYYSGYVKIMLWK
jgi:hypothetical protein